MHRVILTIQILGSDLSDHVVLQLRRRTLKDANLIGEWYWQFGIEIWILEGCISNTLEGHPIEELPVSICLSPTKSQIE